MMARPDIVAEINAFNTWTPSQLVEAFEGSTRKAAEALGISQRSMQRYLTTGKERRTPAKEVQLRMGAAGRKAQGDKEIGMTLEGTIAVNGKGEDYERDRTIDRTFSPEDWDELSQMAAENDEQGIWDMIADSYGVKSMEVTDGDILIGEE